MPLNREALRVAAEVNKEYGEGTVVRASEIIMPDRMTSGSLALDVALGGGWPVNQWHEIVGEESAGKTTTLLQTIAANQAMDPEFTTVWIAAEWYDRDFAEMNGVDNDRVIVVNDNITETAFSIALKYQASKAIDMLVIDSLPAMTPHAEAEADMEELTVGLQARLTNKFMRKQGSSGKRAMDNSERPCTCFLVNQWRDKIGIQFGDPRTTPGGKGKNYQCFTRTEIRRDDWITTGPKSAKVRVGQVIKARVFKNKSAPPHRVATFDFYFENADVHPAGSIDSFKEMVGLGIVFGVIGKPEGHSDKSSHLEYHGVRANGADNMVEALAGDLDVAEILRKEVLDVASKKKPHDLPLDIDPEEGIQAEPVITEPPKKRTVTRGAKKTTPAKKTTARR